MRLTRLALSLVLLAACAGCVSATAGTQANGTTVAREETRPADKVPATLADPLKKPTSGTSKGTGTTGTATKPGTTAPGSTTGKEPTVSAGSGKIVDAGSPKIVASTAAVPASFVVAVNRSESTTPAGATETTTTLAFTPDPPQVTLSLYAPAGSQGAKLAQAEVSYEWTLPGATTPKTYPAERFPIAPTTVPLASTGQDGNSVSLQIPLPITGVRQAYKGADLPDGVTAHVRLVDADGMLVAGTGGKPFDLTVPFRKKL